MTDRKQLNNEQAILGRFQELRNEISQMSAKANELAAESQEHELVLKALEHLEGERKCYRVVRQPLRGPPMCWHVAFFYAIHVRIRIVPAAPHLVLLLCQILSATLS